MPPELFRKSLTLFATLGRAVGFGVVLLGLALVAGEARAQSEDSLYTVSKLPVDVAAKSAVEAKAKAMAEAGERAFHIVLKRVAPIGAAAQLAIQPQEIESLIGGLSVRNERMSSTRYIASLDISFNEQALKEFLAGRGIPVSERRGPPIAIMPLTLEGEKVTGAGSPWYQAWMGLDLSHGIVTATIIQPREGLDARLLEAVLAGDANAYEELKGAYSGQPVVVAVGQPQGEGYMVRLAGADGVGQINFGQTLMSSGDADAVAREAAEFALSVIENRWKAQDGDAQAIGVPAPDGSEGLSAVDPEAETGEPERSVVALVEFSGLQQWQEMRNRLMYVPGLQGFEVNQLSARGASVSFGYAGSLGHLQKVLAENGFSFENAEDNFIIRAR